MTYRTLHSNSKIDFFFYFQLVDKLNTNTEMEEMINDYNTVSPL